MSRGRKKRSSAQVLEVEADVQLECAMDDQEPQYEFHVELVDAEFDEMQMTSIAGVVYDVHHECPCCDAAVSTRGAGYPVMMCPRCRVKMIAQPTKAE